MKQTSMKSGKNPHLLVGDSDNHLWHITCSMVKTGKETSVCVCVTVILTECSVCCCACLCLCVYICVSCVFLCVCVCMCLYRCVSSDLHLDSAERVCACVCLITHSPAAGAPVPWSRPSLLGPLIQSIRAPDCITFNLVGNRPIELK